MSRPLELPKWAMQMALEQRWRRLKAAMAVPFLRQLLRRPSHLIARNDLAAHYLRGDGIEVGGLNAPLQMPRSARVRYVDRAPETRRLDYGEIASVSPDIISDVETLAGIDDGSVDFVVANHVLEHVENPLRALAAISRVLRPGGLAFITLPEKTHTFDKRRAVTPLWHVVRDYKEGPAWSRYDHYLDWARNAERRHDASARAKEMEERRQNIHFHVWDREAMRAMFDYASSTPEIALAVEHEQYNRGEVIWLLRRPYAAICCGSIAAN